MTRDWTILLAGLVALGMIVAMTGHGDEKTATGTEAEIAESLKKLIFVPHDSGAPEVTDAGGVRSVTLLPKIELLAPARMARTLSPSPTLYWHISKPAPGPVRFTLLADDLNVIDPLLELDIQAVDQEGIYGISLDDHNLTLDDGQRYVWSIAVSLSGESPGGDMVAQTILEHTADPALTALLQEAGPEDRAVRLGAEGYWYDALGELSSQIGKPGSPLWRDARARLLDQAGLLQAAGYDRRALTR